MTVVLAPKARDDLDEIHAYIAADNPDAADLVQEAAFETFAALDRTPGLGRLRRFSHPLLADLRSFGVHCYPNYVIFHRIRANCLEVARVLHGAQDLDAILGDD